MLNQRLLSAFIIILGISLLILLLNNQYLTYLVALISSISLWEFLKVRFTNAVSILGVFLFLILMFVSFSPFFSYLFITLSVITYFLSSILILSFPLNKNFLKRSMIWSLFGFIIHLGFFASLIQIISNNNFQFIFPEIESGKFLIFYIVLIAILMDSIAFFAGKSLGKRPFITNVSPNKTLEGFMAAIVVTPLLLSTTAFNILNLPFFLVLSILLVVSLYSVLGDAFASMMKRVVEVKDYSNLIPGHGGLFDRLDSHVAAFPCFVFLLNIV
ncbi:phosphatidate cytidylyltransferase [SAR86 cluster bacterium]|nr:phosphatidate cytidylyltransferase [SAR86 cluster bacterium]